MRLVVLALTVPALAQPALAREHGRHHHAARAHHSHHDAAYLRPSVFVTDERFGRVAEAQPRVAPSVARSLAPRASGHGELDAMIARHAQANGVPEALVHRVVIRESRYNARSVGRGG